MKCIIAGSRMITDYSILEQTMEHIPDDWPWITEGISGGARGIDILGERWFNDRGIPCKIIKPDWERHGRSAGMRRNYEMLDYAGLEGAVVAIWDGESPGTRHTIVLATMRRMRAIIRNLKKDTLEIIR